MGLGLLVPAFLVGLAALAVPVILHLRHRDKDRPQKFPSLMFLELLPIRTSERRRITDWPLLLLRALALALLVLAFARPVFSRSAAAEKSARSRAVVVLLDRSMSMGLKDVWPAAVDSARAVISKLDANDRVALVLFDDEAEVAQPFTRDKTGALAILAKAVPSPRGTHFAAALRAARQLINRAGDAKSEVVLISDLQQGGVGGVAGLDLPAGLSIRAVNVGSKDHANTAVLSAEVSRTVDGQRTLLTVKARVISRDLAAARRVRVSLTLNGRSGGTQEVTVPTAGDVPVSFAPVLLPAGQVRGSISLEPDRLAADDSLHFAFTADDAARIALIAPDDVTADETLYFEHAVAVSKAPLMRVDRMREGALDARALARVALVVFWDKAPAGGATGTALNEWVKHGGGVVVVAGRRLASGARASALLPASTSGNVDRLSDRGGSIGDVRLDHPLFAIFRDAAASLNSARFLQYPRLDPAAGSDVLARFDDGLPAVVERRQGSGRVVLVDLPLDSRNGDFPVQPAYLPFLQRLVLYASGHDATTLWRATGTNWLLPSGLSEPAVSTPLGAIVRPPRDTVGATVALREAGVYALYEGRVQGEPVALLAVNAPANESDLSQIDPKDLLLGVRPAAATPDATGDAPTREEVESRQRLWRVLLVVVAALLVAETFVANRGWRGTANRLAGAPSDRGDS
ncbi:MAG: BatA domain-containing protein [bacterium]